MKQLVGDSGWLAQPERVRRGGGKYHETAPWEAGVDNETPVTDDYEQGGNELTAGRRLVPALQAGRSSLSPSGSKL